MSVVQRTRPVTATRNFQLLQPSRNYFWSSKKSVETPAVSTTSLLDETSPPNPSTASNEAVRDPASVVSEETATLVTTDTLAEASSEITPTSEITEIPPLHYGDFSELGLVSWTPAGFIRWTFELVQVSTGMPWFYTLVTTTLLYRIVLLPFGIKALRNSARLLPMTPRLLAIKQEMDAVRATRDPLAMQRVALKQKKIYDDAGVELGPMMLNPFIQLPVTLGLFFAVRKMCTLPVEQLKQSGLAILPDLTVPDPYFILPILATALINIQISVRLTVFYGRLLLPSLISGYRWDLRR
jgi:YidC/Oxa1 family membrane protein insertase